MTELKAFMFYDFAITINVLLPDGTAGDTD